MSLTDRGVGARTMPEGTEEPNKLDSVFCIQDWSGVNQAISLIMISDSMGVKKRMKYLNFEYIHGHCSCMYLNKIMCALSL